ncbi:MAG: hypothetical protein ACFE9L_13515 [Candidatus Hodarchaeota archaeon]
MKENNLSFVKRTRTQVRIFRRSLDLPIIATLPGAFSDQMQYAVKELSELGIQQVIIRGGCSSCWNETAEQIIDSNYSFLINGINS